MGKNVLLMSLVIFGVVSFQNIGISAENDTTVDKLIADYANNPSLAPSLVGTAGQSAWDRKYDDAKKLYQAVIDKNPNSPVAAKARVGLARMNVLTLIEEKKYSLAQQQVESMAADFNSEPELPVALFHIGKEFTWQHRYSEAKGTFAHIVDNPLARSFSGEIRLWSARANICSLIGKSSDSEVVAAIDKMLIDFNGDSGLPEALFWVSKEYEWKKGTSIGRVGWYDTPNSVYQKIMQEFGDSPYGQQAEWDQKRLAHRMKIFKLMKEPNEAATDAAIEAMATDLKGRPELASELYWVAFGYEEYPDKTSQSEKIYERIVNDCQGTDEADRAVLDLHRRVMCDMFDSGDTDSSAAILDKFVSDFKQHPYAGDCLGRAEIGFYTKAAELRDKKDKENSIKYAQKAADVWEGILKNNLNIATDGAYLYFYAGANYLELQRWDAAIQNFQKVLDNWTDFTYACVSQAAIVGCYEALRDSGSAPKEVINPLIEDGYKAILANYPDCYANKEATYKLGGLMLEKGDKASAIKYYQEFLELADTKTASAKTATCAKARTSPLNKRIETAKTILAELTAEGGNN
jgi:tetratricopeptide (TPR) repeat protein